MIHLDANASTPLLPEVLEAMLPWLRDGHANPSGAYAGARRAREAIEQAREQFAKWIGAEPDEIVFTSGGTESVNTASPARARRWFPRSSIPPCCAAPKACLGR